MDEADDSMVKIEDEKDEKDNSMDESTSSAEEIEDPCPVCLSTRKNESGIDGCAHTFCYSCITEWLKVSETCPLCKKPVTIVRSNVDGNCIIKKLSELKAEAEAVRIMAQAGEVPMTSEREAVTHLIHLQRAEVQKVIESKQRSRNKNSAANELYRRETSKLTQLTALRDEMDRIPRRDIMGDVRFRRVVYELQLQWKAITRPSTITRFTPESACADTEGVWARVQPFLMRELGVIMIDKKNVSMRAARQVFIHMQNYQINNPNFEVGMLNTRLYIPSYIETFSQILYEFCASGLDLPAFDANSSYSLDPARAPSGRFIPSFLPASSRTSNPIFIEGASEDERDDNDVIIDTHRSDSSSNDSVTGLYNHRACRLPLRAPPPPPPLPDFRTLAQRMMEIMPSVGTFGGILNPLQYGRPVVPIGGPSTSNGNNAEVISLDDDSTSDVPRINSIHDNDASAIPSWLNVTGELPSTSNGFSFPYLSSDIVPTNDRSRHDAERTLRNRLMKKREEQQLKDSRANWKSWKSERDREKKRRESDGRSSRDGKRRKEEEKSRKDEEWMGERVGSRRNELYYYYNKMNGGDLSLSGLERVRQDLQQFSRRVAEMDRVYKDKIEEKRREEQKGQPSSQNTDPAVVDLDDDVISIQEDAPGPSTSNPNDESIVIL
ncbi:hypothetical protein PFISCL1PPCAC_8099 [Pristionchus fissidentatus]|uniref:RING-type E3 ubiquitin transferase n=1 Tax=Pristionchus fissidentatus TaxID=1538716 RepID=A0AAV5VDI5_9BILA|nr:hypothetical protein PFISCL1PPCAC_8099 [Pristionchus fissidentatus]